MRYYITLILFSISFLQFSTIAQCVENTPHTVDMIKLEKKVIKMNKLMRDNEILKDIHLTYKLDIDADRLSVPDPSGGNIDIKERGQLIHTESSTMVIVYDHQGINGVELKLLKYPANNYKIKSFNFKRLEDDEIKRLKVHFILDVILDFYDDEQHTSYEHCLFSTDEDYTLNRRGDKRKIMDLNLEYSERAKTHHSFEKIADENRICRVLLTN